MVLQSTLFFIPIQSLYACELDSRDVTFLKRYIIIRHIKKPILETIELTALRWIQKYRIPVVCNASIENYLTLCDSKLVAKYGSRKIFATQL